MRIALKNGLNSGGGVMPLVLRVELDASPGLLALVERVLTALVPGPAVVAPAIMPAPPAGAAEAVPMDATDMSTDLAAAVAEPPAPPPLETRRWTPDRIELLRRDFPSGRPMGELLAALLALPGVSMTAAQVSTYAANQLHLRRSQTRPPETVRWSEERRELLRRDWPTHRPRTDILRDLQARPGAPLTAKHMVDYARVALSLVRPAALDSSTPTTPAPVPPPIVPVIAAPDAGQHPATPVANPPEPPLPPRLEIVDTAPALLQAPAAAPTEAQGVPAPRPTSTEPLQADYGTIMAWAGQRGLASVRDGMDIDKVNAKRRELGLAPFVMRGRARAA